MRKSSSASNPNCDGELLPTVAVTSGRAGRLMLPLSKTMQEYGGVSADDYAAFVRYCFEDPLDAEIFRARFEPEIERFKLAG